MTQAQFLPIFKCRFQKYFVTSIFLEPGQFTQKNLLKICWTPQIFFEPKVFVDLDFSNLNLLGHNFLGPNFLFTKNLFGSKTFRRQVFWTWIVFGSEIFGT